MSRLLLAALLLLALAAAPAQAAPLLDAPDADELAQTLADAAEAQGVCYGWNVSVIDGSGGPSGVDVGSDRGVGVPVDPTCPKYVELRGSVRYTCDSCEADDSSGFTVVTNLPNGPTEADLEQLGLQPGGLAEDSGDVTLINLAGGLPLVTASKGEAAPVPVTDSAAPAAGDVPTGSPSAPDWLRKSWPSLVLFLLMALGGAAWLITITAGRSIERRMSAFTKE